MWFEICGRVRPRAVYIQRYTKPRHVATAMSIGRFSIIYRNQTLVDQRWLISGDPYGDWVSTEGKDIEVNGALYRVDWDSRLFEQANETVDKLG